MGSQGNLLYDPRSSNQVFCNHPERWDRARGRREVQEGWDTFIPMVDSC